MVCPLIMIKVGVLFIEAIKVGVLFIFGRADFLIAARACWVSAKG